MKKGDKKTKKTVLRIKPNLWANARIPFQELVPAMRFLGWTLLTISLHYAVFYWAFLGPAGGVVKDSFLGDNLLFLTALWVLVLTATSLGEHRSSFSRFAFRGAFLCLESLILVPTSIVVGYMVLYRGEMNALFLDWVWFTTILEVEEFFVTAFAEPKAWVALLASAFVAFLVLWALMKRTERAAFDLPKRQRPVLMAIFGTIVVWMFISAVRFHTLAGVGPHIRTLRDNFIPAFYISMFRASMSESKVGMDIGRYDSVSFDVVAAPPQDEPYRVVLVLGESATRYRLGAFGYERNTTPFLSRLLAGDVPGWKGTAFTNAWSPTIATAYAFNVLLAPEGMPFFKLMNQAGYRTAYISNNSALGRFDDVMHRPSWHYAHEHWLSTENDVDAGDYKAEVLSVMPTSRMIYGKTGRFEGQGRMKVDSVLLPRFGRFLEDNEKGPVFAVLHLRGSHFFYRYRYPEAFAFFGTEKDTKSRPETPGLKKARTSWADDKDKLERLTRTFDEYDNSVLYTDQMLEKIFELIGTDVPTAVVFLSDHGEDCLQEKDDSPFRSLNEPTKPMFAIPLAVLRNQVWSDRFEGKENFDFERHRDVDLSLRDVPPILADLARVRFVRNDEPELAWGDEKPRFGRPSVLSDSWTTGESSKVAVQNTETGRITYVPWNELEKNR